MKILRLLLFEECNRDCSGCINKRWDLKSLPVAKSFNEYDVILLTGGEPMLRPLFVVDTITNIKKETDAKIFVYTAKLDTPCEVLIILDYSDGMCVTLHEQKDVEHFVELDRQLTQLWEHPNCSFPSKSLRLNVFEGVDINLGDYPLWTSRVKKYRTEDSYLPKGEVFMRLTDPKQEGVLIS